MKPPRLPIGRRFRRISIPFLAAVCLAADPCVAGPIPVVVPPEAESPERLAARDLLQGLRHAYPTESFELTDRAPDTGNAILLGRPDRDAAVREALGAAKPAAPDGYTVAAVPRGEKARLGVIAGADARGVAYGVEALLHKLGGGAYLSAEIPPEAIGAPLSFDAWNFSDQPLVRDRVVFDWHNFLSGCSSWDREQWADWSRRSQKMGFNAIMVHAYGNNPMVTFSFNGKTKPTGSLTSTVQGRDWSTPHVNDVRKLIGGAMFPNSVFCAEPAMLPTERQPEGLRELMRNVFADATDRAMDVWFAVDLDTESSNPQEIIQTLPESARIHNGRFWLANPETPEGYDYYKAQMAALLDAYPQIRCLVVWFRAEFTTPWMSLPLSSMPARWQEEFQTATAATPDVDKLHHAAQFFAFGKVVKACERAVRELGHEKVRVASGTWRFDFLAPADRFFPPGVTLIGLDYMVLHGAPQLRDEASRKMIRDVAAHRPVVPVIWAQHDDGAYLGSSFTPFPEFASKLTDAGASGYGIIHWTTRPNDLFFASHARQVWQSTRDEPLATTCADFAVRWFGVAAAESMTRYLHRFATEAPRFARETSETFIDRDLKDIDSVLAGCRERGKLIEEAAHLDATASQRDHLDYFRRLEQFIAAVYEAQGCLQRSVAALKAGDTLAARAAIASAHPEKAVELYAGCIRAGGSNRGEEGLLISMNLRWLPYFTRQKQALGMEAVRYAFGPTSHDPLAQAPGTLTWFADPKGQLWQQFGQKETGVDVSTPVPSSDEAPQSALEVSAPFTFHIRATPGSSRITEKAKPGSPKLPPGQYRLRLFFGDSPLGGDHRFTVSVMDGKPDPVDLKSKEDHPVREREYPVTVGETGEVTVLLTPERGTAVLNGALLEPQVQTP